MGYKLETIKIIKGDKMLEIDVIFNDKGQMVRHVVDEVEVRR